MQSLTIPATQGIFRIRTIQWTEFTSNNRSHKNILLKKSYTLLLVNEGVIYTELGITPLCQSFIYINA
jgi:hypothetical protein